MELMNIKLNVTTKRQEGPPLTDQIGQLRAKEKCKNKSDIIFHSFHFLSKFHDDKIEIYKNS